mgnify:FL=1
MKLIRSLAIVALLPMMNFVHAETIYQIEKFSDRYSAKVIVDPENIKDWNVNNQDYFDNPNALVIVFDEKQQKNVIEQPIAFYSYDTNDKDELKSNVLEMPYGEQSIIQYNDFNFDGIPDIAVKIGNFSCYGGPAYNIYLGQENGFKYDSGFTAIATEYCGMFDADKESQTISAMTKSGCCWHKYDTYRVEGEDVWLSYSRVESTWRSAFLEVSGTWFNQSEQGAKDIIQYMFFDGAENDKSIVSFAVNDHRNRVILDDYGNINYYFLKTEKASEEMKDITEPLYSLEFIYPPINLKENQSYPFIYESNNGIDELIFNNGWAEYRIYETKNSVGVKVIRKGKTHDIKGDYQSLKGHLADFVKSIDVENLEMR